MNGRGFEWDGAKARSNYRKHGVDFEIAIEAFKDFFAVEEIDQRGEDYGEDRFLITGLGGGPLLTVDYTERGELIRIISARQAARREHDNYYFQNSAE